MMMTLRKSKGVRFISKDKGQGINDKTKPSVAFVLYPSSVILSTSALYRCRDDDGKADHDRADDNAERCILVFFDLFVDMEYAAQNSVRDAKNNKADKDEYERRDQHLKQLIELNDHPQCGID